MISKYAASILLLFFCTAQVLLTVVADYKSTFLIGAAQYSTLSWLSDGSNNHLARKGNRKIKVKW